MSDKLDHAIEVIVATQDADRQERIARGLKRRAEMADLLKAGIEPAGPRADWLDGTASAIIKLLQERAGAFNDASEDDAISTKDMVDALATVMHVFLDKSTAGVV